MIIRTQGNRMWTFFTSGLSVDAWAFIRGIKDPLAKGDTLMSGETRDDILTNVPHRKYTAYGCYPPDGSTYCKHCATPLSPAIPGWQRHALAAPRGWDVADTDIPDDRPEWMRHTGQGMYGKR